MDGMTEGRWREIMAEEGYTEVECDFLLAGKPKELRLKNLSEDGIREAARAILPAFTARRSAASS